MTQLIRFKDVLRRRKKQKAETDLTVLLKEATLLRKSVSEPKEGIQISGLKKLRSFFEAKISDILISHRHISSDFFLCGNYISGLLTGLVDTPPKSWFIIDYIMEGNDTNNPQILKQGANVCFLICSVFKGRSEYRLMTYSDYEKMGMGLFLQFYHKTGIEIGYYMSRQYQIMVGVTDECIRTI